MQMDAVKLNADRGDLIVDICGARLTLLREGALWWAERRMLVVSDLHFEKGSSYAAGGQMLPPYDTGATLGIVDALFAAYQPDICISLGDSFHDGQAEHRLSPADAAHIRALTGMCDWVWVEGNHDPDPPASLGGRAARRLDIGPLVFRHEPIGETGEIAGHLHPVAKVKGSGRSVRVKCFAGDAERLILPSLGAFTGGLNVCHTAFAALFPAGITAYAIGGDRIYKLAGRHLIADRTRAG